MRHQVLDIVLGPLLTIIISALKTKISNIIWFVALLLTLSGLAVGSAYGYTFSESTLLSSGKWVKVEIDSTALYEISYSELRNMGFEEPSKVGVYGKGGRMFSINFSTPGDNLPYSDVLSPVAVIHENDRLLFYGVGMENISYSTDSKTGKVSAKRNPLNIYSSKAYYFLTDKDQAPKMAEQSTVPSAQESVSSGYGYIYHENDLEQNSTGTGQLFWGESLKNEPNSLWVQSTPFRIAGNANFSYVCYQSYSSNSVMEYGVDALFKEKASPTTSSSKKYVAKSFQYDFVMDEKPVTSVSIKTLSTNSSFLNLDYWLLTYPKRFPESSDKILTETYFFPTKGGRGYELSVDKSRGVLNVTDPSSIVKGVATENGQTVAATGAYTTVLIYDRAGSHRKIGGWSEVQPNNLHSLASQGADLLIITVPRFRKYAEQISGLHELKEGLHTIVVTPEEIYNEFSGGVPDPVAYRAFAKMLHESDNRSLRNILLLGPSSGNNRFPVSGETEFDRILAFQEPEATMERSASAVYDYYGMTSDLVYATLLHKETLNMGVGLLPCETDEECERMIEKIREYLDDSSHVAWLGNSIVIGGDGDTHTHDIQASDFKNFIRECSVVPLSSTVIAIDAYGYKGAREQFISRLNEGSALTVYFGHGSKRMFGKNTNFFTCGETVLLKNKPMGFAYFGGCDFTVPDKRMRGLGETFVLDSPRGMAGAVVSTRSTWSNQNYDFGRRLVNNWYNPETPDSVTTIGEIYAKAKSGSDYANSTCYVLIGDPALRIPAPRRMVKFDQNVSGSSLSPGGTFNLKGKVCISDGTEDSKFNGNAMVRFMESAIDLLSEDYVTGDKLRGDSLIVRYDTSLMESFEGKVTDGILDIAVPVPSSFKMYAGESLPIYVTCYDPERSYGGAGFLNLQVASENAPVSELDKESPSIDCGFDSCGKRLMITATDNRAINSNGAGIKVEIAGKEYKFVASGNSMISVGSTTCAGYVELAGLTPGEYRASIEATDLEGNRSVTSYDFEVVKNPAPLRLALATLAVTDSMEVDIDRTDGSTVTSTSVRIEDASGRRVFEGKSNGNSFTWNCKDVSGNSAKPGLYRIKATGEESQGKPLYSNWTYFAILE